MCMWQAYSESILPFGDNSMIQHFYGYLKALIKTNVRCNVFNSHLIKTKFPPLQREQTFIVWLSVVLLPAGSCWNELQWWHWHSSKFWIHGKRITMPTTHLSHVLLIPIQYIDLVLCIKKWNWIKTPGFQQDNYFQRSTSVKKCFPFMKKIN